MSPSIEEHRAELEQLCRRYRVVSLSLFGSATRDDFDPERSDYDFLVDFAGLPPGQYADAYFGLLDELRDLLGGQVDLVMADAVTNRYMVREIERTKQLLYAA